MTGIAKTGVIFPSTISQSGELVAEELEQIPYPNGTEPAPGVNWPPSGFTIGSEMAVVTTSVLDEQLPVNVDLSWIQGDTRRFSFLATDVNWCIDNPFETDPTAPPWEAHIWKSRIANPYIFSTYQADHWVPAYGFQYMWWRQHAGVADFDLDTSLIQIADTLQWATRVNLSLPAAVSANILPGSWYRWDVQSRSIPDDPDIEGDVQTHVRGRCRIVTEWTTG